MDEAGGSGKRPHRGVGSRSTLSTHIEYCRADSDAGEGIDLLRFRLRGNALVRLRSKRAYAERLAVWGDGGASARSA